ncbi:unnamed protein product [Urochloa decumbens]|uniref:Phytocyanin domain-containing protein n=1 Tax=Urochloa decumbens TaxID=240449 RepID=A0ABC9BJP5_9POAL
MASRSALLALLVAVSCVAAASAVSYTVGDTQGWKIGPDYSTWASGKTFNEGDELMFNFATGSHDVAEVDKSGYDGCSGSSSSNTINNGPATVKLTAGTHYYICTFSGHCDGGMKLAVTVGSGSGGSPSPSTPSTPGTPATPAPTTPAAPSPKNAAPARFTAAPALAVAAGVLVKLALF